MMIDRKVNYISFTKTKPFIVLILGSIFTLVPYHNTLGVDEIKVPHYNNHTCTCLLQEDYRIENH